MHPMKGFLLRPPRSQQQWGPPSASGVLSPPTLRVPSVLRRPACPQRQVHREPPDAMFFRDRVCADVVIVNWSGPHPMAGEGTVHTDTHGEAALGQAGRDAGGTPAAGREPWHRLSLRASCASSLWHLGLGLLSVVRAARTLTHPPADDTPGLVSILLFVPRRCFLHECVTTAVPLWSSHPTASWDRCGTKPRKCGPVPCRLLGTMAWPLPTVSQEWAATRDVIMKDDEPLSQSQRGGQAPTL